MKRRLFCLILILLSAIVTVILVTLPPSDEKMKYKSNSIKYCSTVTQYYKKYGKYPDSLMKAYIGLWGDERNNMVEYKPLMELGESIKFNNKGGWVYSPENKYVQVNLNAYKDIKIEIHITPEDMPKTVPKGTPVLQP